MCERFTACGTGNAGLEVGRLLLQKNRNYDYLAILGTF